MAKFDEQLQEYRKLLQNLEIKSLESYDKAVMSLSGGGLGISFAFINDYLGEASVNCKLLLVSSWVCWSISILIVIFSYLFSHYAIRKAIESVDNGEITDSLGGKFDIITRVSNVLSGLLFFIGTILMVMFVSINIH